MHDEPHDSWASVYDEAYQKSFGGIYSSLTDLTLDFVQTNTRSGASILDVGAGTGRLSIPLSEFGFTVVAVDASSQMLRVLTQKDLNVASRKVIWLFPEQLRVQFVPFLHGLQGCLAAQG